MSDALSNIGQFFKSDAGKGVMTGGVAGTGLIQNLLANRQAEQKQKFVEGLIQNPAKFSAYVQSFQKPLTAGLTSDISRQTDAYGAERGLGSSPAIMKDVYSQALAPYILQQQQQAQQAALQGLGIYEQSPTMKPIDVSGILKALMMGQQKPQGASPSIEPLASQVMQPSYMPGGGPSTSAPFDPTNMGSILPPPMIGADPGMGGFDPVTQEGN